MRLPPADLDQIDPFQNGLTPILKDDEPEVFPVIRLSPAPWRKDRGVEDFVWDTVQKRWRRAKHESR
jgi:hypothetical protein